MRLDELIWAVEGANNALLDLEVMESAGVRFTFVEEWASDAAIEAHLSTPHVQSAFSKVHSLLANDPDIRRYVITA